MKPNERSNKHPSTKTWRDRTHYLAFLLYEDHKVPISTIVEAFQMEKSAIQQWVRRGRILSNYRSKMGGYIGDFYGEEEK